MPMTQKEIMEFTPGNKIKAKAYPRREDARFVCTMCGKDAGPLCDTCLKDLVGTMVESVLEQLIRDGKLDPILERVLERHVARGDAPHQELEDHELVDVYSGDISDQL